MQLLYGWSPLCVCVNVGQCMIDTEVSGLLLQYSIDPVAESRISPSEFGSFSRQAGQVSVMVAVMAVAAPGYSAVEGGLSFVCSPGPGLVSTAGFKSHRTGPGWV